MVLHRLEFSPRARSTPVVRGHNIFESKFMELILALLDNIILIAAGVMILYFQHFSISEKYDLKFFKNTKRATIFSVVFMLIGIAGIPKDIYDHNKNQISVESIEDALSDSTQVAQRDTIYNSRLGFQLLIPKGYQYSIMNNDLMSIILKKDRALLVVTTANGNKSLLKFSDEVCEVMKEQNSTIVFDKISDDPEKVILEFNSLTEVGQKRKGYLAFIKKYGRIHNLTVSCIKNDFLAYNKDFQDIINSFKNQ